jgi:hypothetical protein
MLVGYKNLLYQQSVCALCLYRLYENLESQPSNERVRRGEKPDRYEEARGYRGGDGK